MPSIVGFRGFEGNSRKKALRVFLGSFRDSSGISSGNSQPNWGYGLLIRKGLEKIRTMNLFPLGSLSLFGDTLTMQALCLGA